MARGRKKWKSKAVGSKTERKGDGSDATSSKTTEAEAQLQVLSWIYEYTVKSKLHRLSCLIEEEFKRMGKQPDVQGGFSFVVRRLQVLSSEKRNSKNLKKLARLLEDIMQNSAFHNQHEFYEKAIQLYVTLKLLTLHGQEANYSAIQKQFPCFNWTNIKKKFCLEDDYFKAEFKCLYDASHSAIRESLASNRTFLLLKEDIVAKCEAVVNKSIEGLLACLYKIFPTLTLEVVSKDYDTRSWLTSQSSNTYKLLFDAIRSGIDEEALVEVLSSIIGENFLLNLDNVGVSAEPLPRNSPGTSRDSDDSDIAIIKIVKGPPSSTLKRKHNSESFSDDESDDDASYQSPRRKIKKLKLKQSPLSASEDSQRSDNFSRRSNRLMNTEVIAKSESPLKIINVAKLGLNPIRELKVVVNRLKFNPLLKCYEGICDDTLPDRHSRESFNAGSHSSDDPRESHVQEDVDSEDVMHIDISKSPDLEEDVIVNADTSVSGEHSNNSDLEANIFSDNSVFGENSRESGLVANVMFDKSVSDENCKESNGQGNVSGDNYEEADAEANVTDGMSDIEANSMVNKSLSNESFKESNVETKAMMDNSVFDENCKKSDGQENVSGANSKEPDVGANVTHNISDVDQNIIDIISNIEANAMIDKSVSGENHKESDFEANTMADVPVSDLNYRKSDIQGCVSGDNKSCNPSVHTGDNSLSDNNSNELDHESNIRVNDSMPDKIAVEPDANAKANGDDSVFNDTFMSNENAVESNDKANVSFDDAMSDETFMASDSREDDVGNSPSNEDCEALKFKPYGPDFVIINGIKCRKRKEQYHPLSICDFILKQYKCTITESGVSITKRKMETLPPMPESMGKDGRDTSHLNPRNLLSHSETESRSTKSRTKENESVICDTGGASNKEEFEIRSDPNIAIDPGDAGAGVNLISDKNLKVVGMQKENVQLPVLERSELQDISKDSGTSVLRHSKKNVLMHDSPPRRDPEFEDQNIPSETDFISNLDIKQLENLVARTEKTLEWIKQELKMKLANKKTVNCLNSSKMHKEVSDTRDSLNFASESNSLKSNEPSIASKSSPCHSSIQKVPSKSSCVNSDVPNSSSSVSDSTTSKFSVNKVLDDILSGKTISPAFSPKALGSLDDNLNAKIPEENISLINDSDKMDVPVSASNKMDVPVSDSDKDDFFVSDSDEEDSYFRLAALDNYPDDVSTLGQDSMSDTDVPIAFDTAICTNDGSLGDGTSISFRRSTRLTESNLESGGEKAVRASTTKNDSISDLSFISSSSQETSHRRVTRAARLSQASPTNVIRIIHKANSEVPKAKKSSPAKVRSSQTSPSKARINQTSPAKMRPSQISPLNDKNNSMSFLTCSEGFAASSCQEGSFSSCRVARSTPLSLSPRRITRSTRPSKASPTNCIKIFHKDNSEVTRTKKSSPAKMRPSQTSPAKLRHSQTSPIDGKNDSISHLTCNDLFISSSQEGSLSSRRSTRATRLSKALPTNITKLIHKENSDGEKAERSSPAKLRQTHTSPANDKSDSTSFLSCSEGFTASASQEESPSRRVSTATHLSKASPTNIDKVAHQEDSSEEPPASMRSSHNSSVSLSSELTVHVVQDLTENSEVESFCTATEHDSDFSQSP